MPAEPPVEVLVAASCYDPAVWLNRHEAGAWIVAPFSSSSSSENGIDTFTTDWTVRFEWNDGRVLEGPDFSSTLHGGFDDVSNNPEGGQFPPLFDYDGDGISELLLTVRQHEHTREGPVKIWIFAAKGDKVVEYEPARAFSVAAIEDSDHDGRPDLLLDVENDYTEDGYPTHSSRRPETWRLAHSLRDGTFSTTDAVAKAYKPYRP